MNAVKYDELGTWIHVIPDPKATVNDIPDFLLESAGRKEDK
jgi:hypothetical protein